MNILKSLLQPCYAVMLASVVLFLPSICTANNINAAILFFPSTHVVNDNRHLSKLVNVVQNYKCQRSN
ncbi:hypothetical protein QU600_000945 [Orientia tsutsugamushi]|uniref:hypothetical protein n=1 Tax=Orientia tsutsugamushi TaxID=784 RepID=UPI00315C8975